MDQYVSDYNRISQARELVQVMKKKRGDLGMYNEVITYSILRMDRAARISTASKAVLLYKVIPFCSMNPFPLSPNPSR